MFILNSSEYSLLSRYGMKPPGAIESTRVPSEQNPVSVVPNRRDRRVMAKRKGKPSKGTKKDRRLKRNRRRK